MASVKSEPGQDVVRASNVSSSSSHGSTDFVKKLYQMLEQDLYKDVVRWTRNGDSFVVLDTSEFTREILPKHFKHSNFASFVRQLNKYDFHKVKISNDDKQSKDYVDGAWEFQHPDFKMNNKGALENIRRKGPTQKKPAQEQSQEAISSLTKKVQYLTDDCTSLRDELKSMKSKYNNVLESLVQFRTINNRYHSAIETIIRSVSNAGIEIPPVDLPSLNYAGTAAQDENTSKQGSSQPQALNSNQVLEMPQNQQQQQSSTTTHSTTHSLDSLDRSANSQQQLQISQQGPQQRHSQQRNTVYYGPPPNAVPTSNPMVMPVQDLPPPFQGSFNVLLVEDDMVCIQLCRKFLLKYGCTVEIVTDGLSAISVVNKGKYDLVLMDIVMPNLDGASATSVIRNFDSTTPIIAMTGKINDEDLMAYLRHGMSDILAKPFTKEDLYQILEKHLKQRTPVAQQQQQQQQSPNQPSIQPPVQPTQQPVSQQQQAMNNQSPGEKNPEIMVNQIQEQRYHQPPVQQQQPIQPPVSQPIQQVQPPPIHKTRKLSPMAHDMTQLSQLTPPGVHSNGLQPSITGQQSQPSQPHQQSLTPQTPHIIHTPPQVPPQALGVSVGQVGTRPISQQSIPVPLTGTELIQQQDQNLMTASPGGVNELGQILPTPPDVPGSNSLSLGSLGEIIEHPVLKKPRLT
ncbi:kinase-regulated stress-responsive transcription factor [Saccharomycopsis crataegensis]|uniref:Heat shock transcription factor n=1 Tax=Saccharomycopsis crataegensis TaxID=43959 RepID=A0AAV5QSU5_9ASCO|nr:kinase-regulated stress-responsive transcription factor [Saccharomycopsis crataegensis]